jgi:hypothetical protein
MGIVSLVWSFEMKQVVGMGVTLLLFGAAFGRTSASAHFLKTPARGSRILIDPLE